MATTSTVVTVKARLVDVLSAAVDVDTFYAWPGKSTPPECVFLGPHPETADIRLDGSAQIPTIKAGRKQRRETYTVRITVWSFRPELDPTNAAQCEARAFEILAPIESVLADDPRLGLPAGTIEHAVLEDTASTLFPFNAGWATELAVNVAVSAFLL